MTNKDKLAPKPKVSEAPWEDGIIYTKMWNRFLPYLKAKKEFSTEVHLPLLDMLCSLYQEKTELEQILKVTGLVFQTGEGRNGNQVRLRPEATQLNVVRKDIKHYTALLDLSLGKVDGRLGGRGKAAMDQLPKGTDGDWD
ncbi:hypothetical protein EKK58_11285 [Candidatus Dependentiae bacterium]|nr:MAG: hypothetical protein EKK58_11285 [Candidatus Dependentiae bacterium]